ncbi:hypothetical protein C6P45_002654 [Maudiozyma exigua]|uniref:Sulfhydryl oxidase n=1 Tax=Maudiozyma exigua TaxID=34358 RepID=A0A9P6VXL9_MAUEX|nr:hypothetical protein C6P45_002654 [Kazachstania exigua]
MSTSTESKLFNKKPIIIRIFVIICLIIIWILLSSDELDGSIPHSKIFFQSLNLDGYFNTGSEKNDMVETVPSIHINNGPRYMELGRSTWKTFHIMMERFPDINMNKNDDLKKRDKLINWITIMGETYPCNTNQENIFIESIKKYPLPINLNKVINIEWGCHIHNLVNDKLGKGRYNCSILIEEMQQNSKDFNDNIEFESLDKVTLNKEDKQLG